MHCWSHAARFSFAIVSLMTRTFIESGGARRLRTGIRPKTVQKSPPARHGGRAAVTLGCNPDLERFQTLPYGKCRFKHDRPDTLKQYADADRKVALQAGTLI